VEQLGNVLLCCNLSKWLFADLKKLLYSSSYGHWKSCSVFLIFLINKNACYDMISMGYIDSKILEQLGNALLCCSLSKWLFTDHKKLLYSWSYGYWKSSCSFFVNQQKCMLWYNIIINHWFQNTGTAWEYILS